MNENQLHNQNIIVENLKTKLKNEEEKRVEFQKENEFIRRNPNQVNENHDIMR